MADFCHRIEVYYCAKDEQRLLVLDKSKSRDMIFKKKEGEASESYDQNTT